MKQRKSGCCRKQAGGSILDSPRYAELAREEQLAALLRELGHFDRYHMQPKEGQKRILHILLEEGTMTQKELTEQLRVQPGSASEVLGKLERAGLIVRTASREDRRTVDIHLSEAGWACALAQAQTRKARKEKLFSVLSDEEKQTLLDILEKLSRDWKSRAEAEEGSPAE